jgi:hypothetical protein
MCWLEAKDLNPTPVSVHKPCLRRGLCCFAARHASISPSNHPKFEEEC